MFSDESKSDVAAQLLGPDAILQSRYQVVRHLGKGGMGAVYEAIDLRLGHTVALKQTLTSDPQMWKQFEREARLMAGLNHFVLPRVSDYFTEGNRAFLVMQFVEGADLAEMIAQQPGPFPRNAVVAWADQLLDALIYLHAHERQIIHRDIKPHNLKITPEGHIVLLDFGLAKSQSNTSDSGISCTSVYGYTPRYAPLEQIQDLGTSPQSDIYALGATLYHLLTGIKPPDALARAAALVSARPNPLKPANEVNSAVGPELAAILNCAMAQNPDERYASAGDFREALRRVGRIDETTSFNFPADRFDDYTLVAVPGEIEVSIHPISPKLRLGPRALASLFIILVSAFGVFCNYYPWRMPPTATQDQVQAMAGEMGDEPIVEEKSPRTKSRR
jgi:serine/threonine protein kinase